MFIVVYIGGILEAPWTVVDCDGNDTVVLTCRMIGTAGISLILHTELTFGIAAGFGIFCGCNGFRIFFRFGEIHGDVDGSIRTVDFPFQISGNTVTANIIAVLAEFIEIVSCSLRGNLIFLPELFLYLSRPWNQAVHQTCVKKITVGDTVLDQATFHSFVQKIGKYLLQRHGG